MKNALLLVLVLVPLVGCHKPVTAAQPVPVPAPVEVVATDAPVSEPSDEQIARDIDHAFRREAVQLGDPMPKQIEFRSNLDRFEKDRFYVHAEGIGKFHEKWVASLEYTQVKDFWRLTKASVRFYQR